LFLHCPTLPNPYQGNPTHPTLSQSNVTEFTPKQIIAMHPTEEIFKNKQFTNGFGLLLQKFQWILQLRKSKNSVSVTGDTFLLSHLTQSRKLLFWYYFLFTDLYSHTYIFEIYALKFKSLWGGGGAHN
jgi:hypothetical protein